jgi:hypothetical protein
VKIRANSAVWRPLWEWIDFLCLCGFVVMMLIWAKFNQKRSSPNTKNQNLKNFFTPFTTTTYEHPASRIEHQFRYKCASLSNYRETPFFGGRERVESWLAPLLAAGAEKFVEWGFLSRHFSKKLEEVKYL